MENTKTTTAFGFCFLIATSFAATPVIGGDDHHDQRIRIGLTGFAETPLALSTPGKGRFSATIDRRRQEINFVLSYQDLPSTVTQAHIHFGSESQSGGISVFLCTNLGNGPAGTQPCPAQPATVRGTIVPASVIGPVGQGIAPGEFDELVRAIEAGSTYANVHTTAFPAGEIRGQLPGSH
jgi:hypothetical protein